MTGHSQSCPFFTSGRACDCGAESKAPQQEVSGVKYRGACPVCHGNRYSGELDSRAAATAPAGGVTDGVWEAINAYMAARDALQKRRAEGKWMNADFIDAVDAAAKRVDQAVLALTTAARAAEPDGWLYVMHMEGGQKNKAFSEARYDFPSHNPFGRRGRDYSEEYEVTEHPICIAASPTPPTGTSQENQQ